MGEEKHSCCLLSCIDQKSKCKILKDQLQTRTHKKANIPRQKMEVLKTAVPTGIMLAKVH